MAKSTLPERFWARVRKTDTCWLWTGSLRSFGYGSLSVDGKSVAAHRVSWTLHFGPIPEGMHVCHHCDNPPCVRPEHLFLGNNVINTFDRDRKGRQVNSRKTHCKRGHPLEGDNLYVKPTGYRQCMECKREQLRDWRAAQRAVAR